MFAIHFDQFKLIQVLFPLQSFKVFIDNNEFKGKICIHLCLLLTKQGCIQIADDDIASYSQLRKGWLKLHSWGQKLWWTIQCSTTVNSEYLFLSSTFISMQNA